MKILNKPFEMHVVGPLISRAIKKSHANVIYKQETEENQLVLKCLERLIEANFLGKLLPNVSVKVIHNDKTVGLFMSLDQTMFVTVATLTISGMDEAKLALIVANELSHYLMDHQLSRLYTGLFNEKILSYLHNKAYSSHKNDPVRNDFKARTKLQSYSSFYP